MSNLGFQFFGRPRMRFEQTKLLRQVPRCSPSIELRGQEFSRPANAEAANANFARALRQLGITRCGANGK